MKTTVDLPDPLLARAKKVADEEKTTLRDLIERGLRRELAARSEEQPFSLRDCRFGGEGLSAEAQTLGWEELRALVNER